MCSEDGINKINAKIIMRQEVQSKKMAEHCHCSKSTKHFARTMDKTKKCG